MPQQLTWENSAKKGSLQGYHLVTSFKVILISFKKVPFVSFNNSFAYYLLLIWFTFALYLQCFNKCFKTVESGWDGWMEWDGMVIIVQQSSKSTFSANNGGRDLYEKCLKFPLPPP